MSFLESLYRDAILQHVKNPRNRGRLDPATVRREGENPSCGDELALTLRLDGDTIEAIRFEGEGCAISQASASMMTEAVAGRDAEEARRLADAFRAMIRGEEPDPTLGELRSLQGVAKLHARVKCATLAWVTLEAALEAVEGAGDGSEGR